jgi:hypothetical protein
MQGKERRIEGQGYRQCKLRGQENQGKAKEGDWRREASEGKAKRESSEGKAKRDVKQ